MNLIWCNYKNYLQWRENEFYDCLNIVTSMYIQWAWFSNIESKKYHWNDEKQPDKLIFVGINRLKFILLEVVFVFSIELNCTSNCAYDHYICCIKLRKLVWFYLYKNKDQKWLIQIFSSKMDDFRLCSICTQCTFLHFKEPKCTLSRTKRSLLTVQYRFWRHNTSFNIQHLA